MSDTSQPVIRVFQRGVPGPPGDIEQIGNAVEAYLLANPPEAPGLDPEQVTEIVADYLAAHPPSGGTVTPEQIATGIAAYFAANPLPTYVTPSQLTTAVGEAVTGITNSLTLTQESVDELADSLLTFGQSVTADLADKAEVVDLEAHAARVDNPHAVTKAQVGLANVADVDARARDTHTGTQLAETISDFVSTVRAQRLNQLAAPNAEVPLNAQRLSGAADPVNPQDLTTRAWVLARISDLVSSSPAALDTLNELAAALGNDPNFATTVSTALGNKQPLDTDLTAIASLASAANKLPYATGAGTWALADLTAQGRSLLAAADLAALKAILALVKADVGLGNVDNTSDVNKPVSTAAQTALDLKASLAMLAANGKGVIITSNAALARPTLFKSYEWQCPTEPVNMIPGDTWIVVS